VGELNGLNISRLASRATALVIDHMAHDEQCPAKRRQNPRERGTFNRIALRDRAAGHRSAIFAALAGAL
jgi:hypothetical protein